MRICALTLFCSLCVLTQAVGALRVDVTADNSIVLYPAEYHVNGGSLDRIRIKGNQHIVIMKFDTSPLRGKTIKTAELICRKADKDIRHVTISTVQCDWDEKKSNALTSGMQKENGWGVKGAMFPTVTGGNGFSLVCNAESVLKDGWYHWDVDPDLVHACALGLAHGLSIHEDVSDYSRNPRIWSREGRQNRPYLLVTLGDAPPAPQPPSSLEVTVNHDRQEARLAFRAPRNGFAYDISINSRVLPRWNIPFVRNGEVQVVPLRDISLEPGEPFTAAVTVIDRVGRRSRSVKADGRAPVERKLKFPEHKVLPGKAAEVKGVSALPLHDRYDSNGKAIGGLPQDYRCRNSIFDGRNISLSAARGEVVGFQLLLKGRGTVKIACNLPGIRTDIFKALYVDTPKGRVPDPLVPFDEIELYEDHDTCVCVDVYVPYEFNGRNVKGTISLSDGRRLPVTLNVRKFAIPRKASFLCEMNSYGLPNTVKEFYRLQKIAYDHRVHCNILHYSHRTAAPGSRKCNMDMVMASGRRMDEKRYNNIRPGDKTGYWDDFVSVFGPFLSGSCFKDGHRGAIPAPGFYLTFHESWPLNVRAFFNGNPDACKAFKEKPVYAETFVSIMRDFINTAKREGWTETGFQVYLNNKGSLDDKAKNPWILDEPTALWDYRALAYYGDLVGKARGDRSPIKIDYRIDISRPHFDRGELFGKSDLWVVNMDSFRKYNRLVLDRAEFSGEKIWVYGSSSKPEVSSRTIMNWVLEAYSGGADGLVPWQTINSDGSALKRGDQLGLFISDKAASSGDGGPAIHHSMRLKAYRRAEQDVEYLEMLKKKYSLSDPEAASFISHYIHIDGELLKTSDADAGTMKYNKLSPFAFYALREAVAELLEE